MNLGDIAQIGAGNSAPQDEALFANGKHPFCRTADVGRAHISARFSEIADRLNDDGIKGMKLHRKNTILFPKSGASTFLNHRVMLAVDSYVSAHLATIYADTEKVLPDFLFNLLISVDAKNLTSNQNYPSLRLSEIASIQIPLPPLDVQARLVAETKKEEEIIAANRGLIGLMDAKINQVISEI
ncbi:MAG: restriction endonuclease subunit S [Alphaproteobacteria bacterium]|nr:restriction endonuclease subunit S [Alphaproteobacteria bacterium]